MKIKVSEATGQTLDWLVAKAQGVHIVFGEHGPSGQWEMYSSNWAQGGPIIEGEGIYYEPLGAEFLAHKDGTDVEAVGPTPLIVAMRCFVASRLGDEVDVPEELK